MDARELLEKRWGANASLYLNEGPGGQIEVRSDAIPDAAGGEGGHGAASPHGVIHRYVFYSLYYNFSHNLLYYNLSYKDDFFSLAHNGLLQNDW